VTIPVTILVWVGVVAAVAVALFLLSAAVVGSFEGIRRAVKR
jgi:hypothetical protein